MQKKSILNSVSAKAGTSSNKTFNFLIQFLIIAVVFFAFGFVFGQKKVEIERKNLVPKINVVNKAPPGNQNIDFSLFWKVFDTLPEKYIDKSAVDGPKMLYGAIAGMVRSLGDPYTVFLDPKQNEAIKDELSGQYEGIGIQIGFNKDKKLVVIAPLKGTPAEKAGLRAKDVILKIDNRDAFDLTLPEAVDLIRGTAGTKVKLKLTRDGDGKTYEAEIERAKIEVKSVETDFRQVKGKNVAVIRVSRFGDTTDKEWDNAVSSALNKGAAGIIVDMRNNPGGLLSSAVHLGSEFVKGVIVKQEMADGSIVPLSSDHQAKLANIPLVVLVNGGSASASEIFAGAIQDNGRGKIVGEKTFGKGTVQDVVDFPGGSGLHVTIAKWLTPDGHSINGSGITPDVIINQPEENAQNGNDPQLEKGLDLVI